ncbi:MAG TPA: Cof-type HAD-IIB family hydrolase [Acidobacteriota bacterium]|nr:Cof-type HAD-IIB family hydrolase [Acidobacteriota bacterium]
MGKIGLLAMDVDGTLLTPDGKVTDRTRQALEQAERGHHVHLVLATGRRFHAVRPVAQNLGIRTPLITHNGALIKNLETRSIYRYHWLENDIARRLIELGKQCGADTLALEDPDGDGRILTDSVSENNAPLKRYLEMNRAYVRPVPNLLHEVTGPVIQVMFCGPCRPMAELAEILLAEMSEVTRLLMTAYPRNDMTILDLLNPAASKGTALEFVAEFFEIDQSDVMAVGDNHNDIDMLQYAGIGVVMGNAEPELLEMGFHRTASNTEDGLAKAVERFILGLE